MGEELSGVSADGPLIAHHPQLAEFVAFINELADEAGTVLANRHEVHRFDTKADASPVTEFDRGIEQLLRDRIGSVVLTVYLAQHARQ